MIALENYGKFLTNCSEATPRREFEDKESNHIILQLNRAGLEAQI
jgi:hypothetical protein